MKWYPNAEDFLAHSRWGGQGSDLRIIETWYERWVVLCWKKCHCITFLSVLEVQSRVELDDHSEFLVGVTRSITHITCALCTAGGFWLSLPNGSRVYPQIKHPTSIFWAPRCSPMTQILVDLTAQSWAVCQPPAALPRLSASCISLGRCHQSLSIFSRQDRQNPLVCGDKFMPRVYRTNYSLFGRLLVSLAAQNPSGSLTLKCWHPSDCIILFMWLFIFKKFQVLETNPIRILTMGYNVGAGSGQEGASAGLSETPPLTSKNCKIFDGLFPLTKCASDSHNFLTRIVSRIDETDASDRYGLEAADNKCSSSPNSSTSSVAPPRKVIYWEDKDPENPYNWSTVCLWLGTLKAGSLISPDQESQHSLDLHVSSCQQYNVSNAFSQLTLCCAIRRLCSYNKPIQIASRLFSVEP